MTDNLSNFNDQFVGLTISTVSAGAIGHLAVTRVDSVVSFEPQEFDFLVVHGLSYGLRLEFDGGLAEGSFTSPIVWFQDSQTDEPLNFSGLATLENSFAFATPTGVHVNDEQFGFTRTKSLDATISEIRIWETDSGQRIGICTPERHQIRIGEATVDRRGLLSWPFGQDSSTDMVLGIKVGQNNGDFVFPLSFDSGPDGRIFVLDAGNRRIQSFDENGTYITQWGKRGTGDGDFNFGTGIDVDFAGSRQHSRGRRRLHLRSRRGQQADTEVRAVEQCPPHLLTLLLLWLHSWSLWLAAYPTSLQSAPTAGGQMKIIAAYRPCLDSVLP